MWSDCTIRFRAQEAANCALNVQGSKFQPHQRNHSRQLGEPDFSAEIVRSLLLELQYSALRMLSAPQFPQQQPAHRQHPRQLGQRDATSISCLLPLIQTGALRRLSSTCRAPFSLHARAALTVAARIRPLQAPRTIQPRFVPTAH